MSFVDGDQSNSSDGSAESTDPEGDGDEGPVQLFDMEASGEYHYTRSHLHDSGFSGSNAAMIKSQSYLEGGAGQSEAFSRDEGKYKSEDVRLV